MTCIKKRLIEEIRRKTNDLEKENWHIDFTWIKAHAGNSGNELVDKLVKEAIKNSEICYNKIPICLIAKQKAEKTIQKWQLQWDATTKGRATKEYFPNITQTKNETQTITEPHDDANCAQKIQGIPTPLQDNPVTRVFLQTRRPDNGPSPIRL